MLWGLLYTIGGCCFVSYNGGGGLLPLGGVESVWTSADSLLLLFLWQKKALLNTEKKTIRCERPEIHAYQLLPIETHGSFREIRKLGLFYLLDKNTCVSKSKSCPRKFTGTASLKQGIFFQTWPHGQPGRVRHGTCDLDPPP